jgi:hypothetical protein
MPRENDYGVLLEIRRLFPPLQLNLDCADPGVAVAVTEQAAEGQQHDDYLALESQLIFPEFVTMLARCAQVHHERMEEGGQEPQSDPDSLTSQLEIFLWDTAFPFGYRAMLLSDDYGTRPDFDHESESEYEEEEEEGAEAARLPLGSTGELNASAAEVVAEA